MTVSTPSTRRLPLLLATSGIALALVFGVAIAKPGDRDSRRGPAFELVDADADGKITRAEAEAYIAVEQGSADMNADGFVSFEEAKAHRQAKRELRARERYQRLDRDGDGKVSASEFQAPAAKMFERLDRNDDGVISEDERPRHRRGHNRH